MAESLLAILDKLEARIKKLTEENGRLRSRNAELESLHERMIRDLEEAEELRRRAELDAEYLAVSHKLADKPQTLVSTRRHISQLIRNIDRCLEMLKE